MFETYNLNHVIDSFFASNTSVTRQQCDDFTRSHATAKVDPVQVQGAFSYTVTVTTGLNSSKLFQFRVQDSKLDQNIIILARATHAEYVATAKYHGMIGTNGKHPLHVYEMDNIPGIPYIMTRDIALPQPLDSISRQRNTTKDLARYDPHAASYVLDIRLIFMGRFFAQSWNNKQILPKEEIKALLAEFDANFKTLAQSLPPRFKSNLLNIRRELPSLFSGALPFVLSHGDLCEMNILTNRETGEITGIVDWAEARILPFGFSLWGLENVLGFMDSEGWHYFDNREELQRLFWDSFRTEAIDFTDAEFELVQCARLVGLFCRYGFIMDGMSVKGVADQSSPSKLKYLDAFCIDSDQISGELDRVM